MPNIAIRAATEADLKFIEANLRPADFEEFVMSRGRGPIGRFHKNLEASREVTVGLYDDTPACAFGITPMGDHAAPWMMGTPLLEEARVARTLVRAGRNLFARWASKYGQLRNYVYAKNALHIRYIRALGCTVHDAHPRGILNAPFREFTYNV